MRNIIIFLLIASSSICQANSADAPCNGAPGKYRTSGGFVADTAFADIEVYIQQGSEVCEDAYVYRRAQISESSTIRGRATIRPEAVIKNSLIYGDSFIHDKSNIINSKLRQTRINNQCLVVNIDDNNEPYTGCDIPY